ncbi:MAG: hypothetical protein KAI24_00740, partial [Planctomycetes bacterium]|nr:hypothetical protein [Planctomycetota bacterium]
MSRSLLCVIPYCGRLNYLRMLLATIRGADGVDDVRVLIYRTRPGVEIPESLLDGLDASIVEFDLGDRENRVAHHAVWQHVFLEHYDHDWLLGFDCDAAV